jgi:hypothetical protein
MRAHGVSTDGAALPTPHPAAAPPGATPEAAWAARADELGLLTFANLVVRTDRYGKYRDDGGPYTYPSERERARPPDPLSAERLARHYRGEAWKVIGSLTLDTAGLGREIVEDIDAHDGEKFDPDANRQYAVALWQRLRDLGLTALVYASNGKGGYHVRVLFSSLVPGWKLRRFAAWLVRDWREFGVLSAPESNPKQDHPGPDGCGNYVRLPGKHPRRDYWSEVYDGTDFRTGSAAVDHLAAVLAAPNDPKLIPPESYADAELAQPEGKRGGWEVLPSEDYDRKHPDVGELLAKHGWTLVRTDGDGLEHWQHPTADHPTSATVGHKVDEKTGAKLVYPFSPNTPLTPERYHGPSAVLCAYEYGNKWQALHADLAAKGYGTKARGHAAAPGATTPTVGDDVLCFRVVERSGRLTTVLANCGGATIHRDRIDLDRDRDRRRLAAAALVRLPATVPDGKRPDAAGLAQALLELASLPPPAEPPAATPTPAAAAPGEEVDVASVIRPKLVHSPEVSAITVAVTCKCDGGLTRRWRTHLHWAGGQRQAGDLATAIVLADGRTLHVHPDPGPPAEDLHAGWSGRSREAWLAGAPAPDAADLYRRLRDRVTRYVDLPEATAIGTAAVVALWCVFTYLYPAWPAVPYLAVNGPLGSGKSRLLDVLARLVFRPLATASLTGPALFRTLHARGGVVLLDECERLRHTRSPEIAELLSMVLAGYRRGGCATRLEAAGDTYKPVAFQVYGPKALASIAGLPPTLASRCVPVAMVRARSDSAATRRRIDDDPAGWRDLRDDLHLLALCHGAWWPQLADARTWPGADRAGAEVVPATLHGRSDELWQPLLALAAWFETHGVPGLHALVRDHAVASVRSGRDEAVPEADRVLLDVLTDAACWKGEAPSAAELLRRSQELDPATFKLWSPHTVSRRLKSYGICHTSKSRGVYRYQPTRKQLEELSATYELELDFPRPKRPPRAGGRGEAGGARGVRRRHPVGGVGDPCRATPRRTPRTPPTASVTPGGVHRGGQGSVRGAFASAVTAIRTGGSE